MHAACRMPIHFRWRILQSCEKTLQLEELEISLCSLSKESLEVLGRSCRLFKSLIFLRAWNRPVADDGDALIISETMSRLRRLHLDGNRLTDIGLLAILNGCPLLESLYIGGCYHLELSQGLEERCHEQIKDVRLLRWSCLLLLLLLLLI